MNFAKKVPFWFVQFFWVVAIVALVVWFLSYNLRSPDSLRGMTWLDDDPMAFSGFLAVIIGLIYGCSVDRSQSLLLYRWRDAALVDMPEHILSDIRAITLKDNLIWPAGVSLTLLSFMIFGYWQFFTFFDPYSEFALASFACATLVGLRLGRLVSHGLLGRIISGKNMAFNIVVEHPDRTGGAAQIGSFYFFQASVVMVPILWLLAWILILPSYPQYYGWGEHFFNLLIIGAFVFGMAFFLPMRSFNALIKDWKLRNIRERIEYARQELIELNLIDSPTSAERERRRELATYLHNLNNLPSWPISPVIRSAFVTTFVLPIVANIVTSFTK